MSISNVCFQAFAQHGVKIFVCFVLFVMVATLCFFCRDRGFFTAFSVMIISGEILTLLQENVDWVLAVSCMLWTCFLSALVYVLLTCALIVRTICLRRKKRRDAMLKKVQYALPEKENTYIRARLRTALKGDGILDKDGILVKEKSVQENFHAEYAKKLLAKLQNAPLTKAERLELHEVSMLFSAYLKKHDWTAQDIRALNDIFSYLLKLSAKYTV